MSDSLSDQVARRKSELQKRLLSPPPVLRDAQGRSIENAKTLTDELRNVLIRAADEDQPTLASPLSEILRFIKYSKGNEVDDRVRNELKERGLVSAHCATIRGAGLKDGTDFRRDAATPRFRRSDGAQFSFRFIVREDGGSLMVLGYDAEILFPCASWIRFDLNLPGHDNEAVGVRSHLHVGSDAWMIPYPQMSPFELLDLLCFGCGNTRG